MKTDTVELYRKLFQALEEGKKKEERTVLQYLQEKYRIPRISKASEWLAKRVPVEDVFVQIVSLLGPFARILSEIYGFLDSHRATILGKSDQFALRFEELEDRVPFGLDTFPKTFVDVLKTGRADILSFNPDASGRLLIDTPDCWGETGALNNLAHHAFVYTVKSLLANAPGHSASEAFLKKNAEIVERTVARVVQVIEACTHALVYHKESNDDLDCIGYGANKLHFYYRTSGDRDYWVQTVADYNQKKIDRSFVFDRDRDLERTFRRFNLTELHDLTLAWDSYARKLREGIKGKYDPGVPEQDRWERYLTAFESAFHLLFPRQSEPVRMIERIIDSVILPYWKHRWRLYEVWALVLTMNQCPKGAKSVPLLTTRTDQTDAYEWPIPHGDADHPVGEVVGPRSKLEVWFQRKTRSVTGTGHIEPDIRIMKPSPSDEDVFILELKDRHNGPMSHVHKVLKKYSSGSSSKWICLANYSSFRTNEIRGRLTTWKSGEKTFLLADQFRPGTVYPGVVEALQQSIREALQYGVGYDLLVDVSGSIEGTAVRDQLLALVQDRGGPLRIYAFRDTLSPVEGTVEDFDVGLGGNTDIPGVLDEYFANRDDNQAAEVVVITDMDGVQQLKGNEVAQERRNRIILMVYDERGTPRSA